MYPTGDQNVSATITKIVELKEQNQERQRFKNVDRKPVTGYISTKDLIKINKLQKDLFPNYKELNHHLNTMAAEHTYRIRGVRSPNFS